VYLLNCNPPEETVKKKRLQKTYMCSQLTTKRRCFVRPWTHFRYKVLSSSVKKTITPIYAFSCLPNIVFLFFQKDTPTHELKILKMNPDDMHVCYKTTRCVFIILLTTFSVASQTAWNSLPLNIQTAPTPSTVKNLLKTYLFSLSYTIQ